MTYFEIAAAKAAKHFVAIVSPCNLKSPFAQAQFNIAYGKDPTGEQGFLASIYIEELSYGLARE